jgi:mannosyltransferase
MAARDARKPGALASAAGAHSEPRASEGGPPPSAPQAPPAAAALGLLALLGLAAALRLFELGGEGLWFDEVATAVEAGAPSLAESLREARTRDAASPPLFPLALHLWVGLAGASPGALRLPGALAGVAGLLGTWACTRRLVGERAAWVALALGAGLPFLVRYAREARAYSFVFAGAACGGLLLAELWRRPRPRSGLAYAAALWLLLATHYTGFWVAGAWLAASLAAGRRAAAAWSAAAIACALPFPIYYMRWKIAGLQTAHLAGLPPWKGLLGVVFPTLPLPAPAAVKAGGWLLLGLAAVAVAAAAASPARRRAQGSPGAALLLAAWAAAPFAAPALAGWLVGRPLHGAGRYAIGALPALLALAGWGLASLPRVACLAVAGAGAAGLAAASAALCLAQEKPDWAAAARALLRERSGEPVLVIPGYERLSLSYALGGAQSGLHETSLGALADAPALRGDPPPASVWLVTAGRAARGPLVLPEPVARGYRVATLHDAPDLRVLRLTRRASAP